MVKKKIICLSILCLAAIIFVMGGLRMFGSKRTAFHYSEEAFVNPQMGYAPPAENAELGELSSLLYMDITWRELEPKEGIYDWTVIEETNNLELWRSEKKNIVLRFVCDVPGDESHMDIPDWLYEKTDGAGDWYDMEYGKGFSPDYGNETIIAAHKQAVQALGKRFGQDGFVSYVELGSLGHWGEWHVNYHAGIRRLPSADIRTLYVLPWTQSFPKAKILMRRPFWAAKENKMGLFNDMAGEPDSTTVWEQWIKEGGSYDQTGESDLVSMSDYWKQAPVGGELTSSLSMEEMLETNLARTTKLVGDSHTTFLGPKTADKEYEQGYNELLKNMGYRIWIKEAKLKTQKNAVQISLQWENSGVAPMYWDWPVSLYLKDKDDRLVIERSVEISLSQLLPKEKMTTETEISYEGAKKMLQEGGSLYLGIKEPESGEPLVHFAVRGQESETLLKLF